MRSKVHSSLTDIWIASSSTIATAEPPHAENIDVVTNNGCDLAPLLLQVDPADTIVAAADTEVQDTDRTIVTHHDELMDHGATQLVQAEATRS